MVNTSVPIVTTVLSGPSGVTSEGGNAFVVNTNSADVLKYSSSGSLLGTAITDPTDMNKANGITIDSSGNFWVTDEGYNEVTEYSPSGHLMATISGAGGNFNGPNFIVALAVPEPAAWALLLGGLGLLYFFVRRKAELKPVVISP